MFMFDQSFGIRGFLLLESIFIDYLIPFIAALINT